MYARVSSMLAAKATILSSSNGNQATVELAVPDTASAYTFRCGTLSSSTWPLAPTPILVTATSVLLRAPPPPPVCTAASAALVMERFVVSPSPHPLRAPHLCGNQMWVTPNMPSLRSYAACRTRPCLGIRDSASAAAAPSSYGAGLSLPKDSSHAVAGVKSEAVSSDSLPDASATPLGTVMLPDALVFAFHGNPREFQDRLRGANVLVFFYKAACGPCAAIRSKLVNAVASHLPTTDVRSGKSTAAAQGGSASLSGVHEHQSESASPATASAEHTDNNHSGSYSAGAAAAKSSMTNEDKEACELACHTLEDVAQAFPHQMIFLMVDTNTNAKLTALHDIRSLPTFIAYRNGCMIGRVEGAHEREVSELVLALNKGGAPNGDARAAPRS